MKRGRRKTLTRAAEIRVSIELKEGGAMVANCFRVGEDCSMD
ncbi:hypothetical protein L195_g033925 [Trifolium pratense]|uniref:Uncharacterized protein n=1 Tax=Trifolium pratense TaxID=57577 RepID=A0A2K3LHD1_TRIPR|nr:hypothetical protein L195_g033925 [Trifolium pratense]